MSATLANVKPTTVTFDALNTFGGRSRGVLYACCSNPAETAALCELQAALQSALPFCSEQQKNGVFVPHMTLSHFACRDDAEAAKSQLLESWSPITFSTGDECVHVMRRLGGSGQFERACTLRFGGCDASNEVSSRAPIFFEPPLRFEVCCARKRNGCGRRDGTHISVVREAAGEAAEGGLGAPRGTGGNSGAHTRGNRGHSSRAGGQAGSSARSSSRRRGGIWGTRVAPGNSLSRTPHDSCRGHGRDGDPRNNMYQIHMFVT